jgi:hypothetical protein
MCLRLFLSSARRLINIINGDYCTLAGPYRGDSLPPE